MKLLALFLNDEIRTGGHRRLLELLEDLPSTGIDTYAVLNASLPYIPAKFKDYRIYCRYKRKSIVPVSAKFTTSAKSWFKSLNTKFDFDVLMIHGETHYSAARWLQKKTGVPVFYAHRSNTVREILVSMNESSVFSIMRMKQLFQLSIYKSYEKKITLHFNRLAFQSPYDMNDFCSRNPSGTVKSCVIRGNIGLPRFKPETANTNTSTELKKILFVGTLGNRKGVRHLLKAFETIIKAGLNGLTLDVVGPGDDFEYWNDWIKRNDLNDKIKLHGRVADPFAFISDADLMVVPSDFDSYPDTILEALHAGTPVIGSRAGGIPDMLEDDDLLFPVQDPESIVNIISLAYFDNEFYLSLKEKCDKRKSFFHFNWPQEWNKEILKLV